MSPTPQDPAPHGHGPGDMPPPPQHVSARVPDRLGQGVFSTGVIIMTGRHEFVFDFVQNMSRPHRVAARVILPHGVLPQFIEALKTNLTLYTQHFGAPAALLLPGDLAFVDVPTVRHRSLPSSTRATSARPSHTIDSIGCRL